MGNRRLLFIGILMAIVTGVLPGQVLHESIAFYREGNDGAPFVDPLDVHKDIEGNYYFILRDINCNETIIGGVGVDCIIFEEDLDDDRQSYLVKLDNSLQLDTFVVIKDRANVLKGLAISFDQVLVSFTNLSGAIDSILVGDEPVALSRGGVLAFSHDLQYEGPLLQLNTKTEKIASDQHRLFVQGYIGHEVEGNELFTLIEGDTLWNFGGQEGLPSRYVPFIVSYDLVADSIETFWKMGSNGDCYVRDMLVDQNGDLVLSWDTGYASWIDLNGPSLITSNDYASDYLLKYKPDGELVFVSEFSVNLGRLFPGEEGYYALTGFHGHGWINIMGDSISFCGTSPGSNNSTINMPVKFDMDGNFLWYYYPDNDGCSDAASIGLVHEKDGQLSCAVRYYNIDFNLQDQHYELEGPSAGVVNLDAATGVPVSHKITPIDDDFRYQYIEYLGGNRYRAIVSLHEAEYFHDFQIGDPWNDMTFFLDFSLDMITSTNIAPIEPVSNFQLSPNPLHPGTALSLSDVPAGTYTIAVHSITGALLHEEQVYLHKGTNRLGWQPQAAGLYAVSLKSRSQRYTGLVVVQE